MAAAEAPVPAANGSNGGLEGQLRKWAAVLVPAVATAIIAYLGAGQVAGEKSAEVRQRAEAGYQVFLDSLRSLREENARMASHLLRLDGEITAMKRALRAGAPHVRLAAPPAPARPADPPPTPPPQDLAKALEAKAPGLSQQ